MLDAVEKFRDMSPNEPDWRFITDRRLMWTSPNTGLSPELCFGRAAPGRYIPHANNERGERQTATPWGHGAWTLTKPTKTMFEWNTAFTIPFFQSQVQPASAPWTVACMIRPRSSDVTDRWALRLELPDGSKYRLQVENTEIEWVAVAPVGGSYFCTMTVNQVIGQWHMTACTTKASLPRRTARVLSMDGTYVKVTNNYGRDLGQGVSAVKIGDYDKNPIQAVIAGVIVVLGEWTDEDFFRWASRPYGWAENYNQRGVYMPATCPHGDGRILPLVDGEPKLSPAMLGKLAIAQAVDGDASAGPALSFSDEIKPAVSGTARICEGTDGLH